jgi:hypothetical protein
MDLRDYNQILINSVGTTIPALISSRNNDFEMKLKTQAHFESLSKEEQSVFLDTWWAIMNQMTAAGQKAVDALRSGKTIQDIESGNY